jgi:hypothetical protein
MSRKPISYWWAIAIGLITAVLQALIYILRFGGWNPYATLLDHALFFVVGALGGLVLIAFVRASRTPAARWTVLAAYLLAMPLALMGMLVGGLLGPLAVVLFSLVILSVFTAVGYFEGGYFSRRREPIT